MWVTWKITMKPLLIDVSVVVNAKYTKSDVSFYMTSRIEALEYLI